MIPPVKAKLLEGKKGLVVGIANENSIAWGCAKAFRAFGAEPPAQLFGPEWYDATELKRLDVRSVQDTPRRGRRRSSG